MVFGQQAAITYVCTPENEAQMAELVDASDSKSGIGNNVQVRFLFWAQRPLSKAEGAFAINQIRNLLRRLASNPNNFSKGHHPGMGL